MDETIRTVLKRRVRWCLGLGFGGLLLIMLTPLTAGSKPVGSDLLPLLGFGVFFVAMLAVQWLTKCPRCDSKLGQEMAFRVGFSLFRKAPNFCPFCGVSLDEPRSSARTSPTAANPLNPIK